MKNDYFVLICRIPGSTTLTLDPCIFLWLFKTTLPLNLKVKLFGMLPKSKKLDLCASDGKIFVIQNRRRKNPLEIYDYQKQGLPAHVY